MKVYIAGPMRGIEDFNFAAFDEAAHELRKAGYEVFSPADRDREAGFDPKDVKTGISRAFLREAMAADTGYICREADAIALLPGWQNSEGSQIELMLSVMLGHELVGGYQMAFDPHPTAEQMKWTPGQWMVHNLKQLEERQAAKAAAPTQAENN